MSASENSRRPRLRYIRTATKLQKGRKKILVAKKKVEERASTKERAAKKCVSNSALSDETGPNKVFCLNHRNILIG
jgi:hypothetical protein